MSQLILQPFFRFSCITGSSLTSPGEPPMDSYQTDTPVFPCLWVISSSCEQLSRGIPWIMVWEDIGYDDRTSLILVEGRLNVARMVNSAVIPFTTRVTSGIFQQVNARPHTAGHTRNALENVRILDWLPGSLIWAVCNSIQGVSKCQANPNGGDSGSYLEQKILIHFFQIRPLFRVT